MYTTIVNGIGINLTKYDDPDQITKIRELELLVEFLEDQNVIEKDLSVLSKADFQIYARKNPILNNIFHTVGNRQASVKMLYLELIDWASRNSTIVYFDMYYNEDEYSAALVTDFEPDGEEITPWVWNGSEMQDFTDKVKKFDDFCKNTMSSMLYDYLSSNNLIGFTTNWVSS